MNKTKLKLYFRTEISLHTTCEGEKTKLLNRPSISSLRVMTSDQFTDHAPNSVHTLEGDSNPVRTFHFCSTFSPPPLLKFLSHHHLALNTLLPYQTRSMSNNDNSNIASLASQLQSTEINNPKDKINPKEARKAERAAQLAAEQAAKTLQESEDDYSKHLYGNLNDKKESMNGKKVFTSLNNLVTRTGEYLSKEVTVRAHLHGVRGTSKNAFLILRQTINMVQAIASFDEKSVSKSMIKFITNIPKDSLVEIKGTIVSAEIKSEAMSLKTAELHVEEIFVVHEASNRQPFTLDDAARSEDGPENLPRVNLDTRLNHRVFDLKTPTNQAIFTLQSAVAELFSEFLRSKGFKQIFSPKLISAASEGGANVFKVEYFGKPAYLAQSPQFYKQMAIAAGMERVFEIGPVFRAENSFTHRHLTEFTGLDLEMTFDEHYHEVMLLIADMLLFIFKSLPQR